MKELARAVARARREAEDARADLRYQQDEFNATNAALIERVKLLDAAVSSFNEYVRV